MSAGTPPRSPSPRAPTPRRAEADAGTKGRGGLALFLLAGAVPLGLVAWIVFMPDEQRAAIEKRMPSGWGGRALEAGAAFLVMLVLARLALPAFKGAVAALKRAAGAMGARRGFLRVLLYPVELLVNLVLVVVQILYVVDMLAIVAAGLYMLLAAIRIMKPGLWVDVLPPLGS